MEKFKAVPVAHNKDDLFVAIITSEDEKTLIAQCTSLVLARHLVDCHNRNLTQRATDGCAECGSTFFLLGTKVLTCALCGSTRRR
jgi:hypothetical protein